MKVYKDTTLVMDAADGICIEDYVEAIEYVASLAAFVQTKGIEVLGPESHELIIFYRGMI